MNRSRRRFDALGKGFPQEWVQETILTAADREVIPAEVGARTPARRDASEDSRTSGYKPVPHRLLACLVAALLASVCTDRAGAFSYFVFNGVPVTWSGGVSLRFLSPSTFPPGSVAEQHILEAMGLWNIVPASPFQYNYSTLDQDYPIDSFDGFNDTAAVPAAQLDPGVLGVTYLVNSGPDWYDMDILFSDVPLGVGYTFDPNPDCHVVDEPLPSNGFSFLLVAVHELGHALGLGHDPIGNEPLGTPWFIATMNPRYPSGGPIGQESIIELHTDDRAGLRFLYPHSGPSGPAYVDLACSGYASSIDIGRAVPVSVAPGVVLPGDVVSATTVLENLGTSNEFFVRLGYYLSNDGVITTADLFLGSLDWDLAFEDAVEFGVNVPMPADIAAGTYYLGSIFDDDNGVVELYEDNNAAVYCEPLSVSRLTPVINPPGQVIIPCDSSYVGAAPTVTHPLNMAPITWSIDNPQPGMAIHPATGVITWPQPVHSTFAYALFLRATNSAGTSAQMLFLGVEQESPVLAAGPVVQVSCTPSFALLPPALTLPGCMAPVLFWSLDAGPAGLSVHPATGVISWPNPIPAGANVHAMIRAINGAGSGVVDVPLRVTAGDMNGSGAVTLGDVPFFTNCLMGPSAAIAAGCTCAEGYVNGHIDLRDVQVLQNGFGQ